MYVLRTGLQGNGKTLNTIKEVDQKAAKEGRTVYYHNITGFKPDHPAIKAKWVYFDHPETWFELPKNAIIVIDEAQTWFRVRPQGSKVPEYASRLEIMRKDGHELHAITQSPKLIDAHMRELCNCHIHYNRGNGSAIIKRWVFQKPEMTVSSKLEWIDGESSRITIDKTYFGCYESVKEGTGHHFKFRPPKAMYVLGVCVLLLIAAGWRISQRVVSPDELPPEPVQDAFKPLNQTPAAPKQAPSSSPVTAAQYAEQMTPRIKDVPASAPIYDQLTAAKSFPKPFCIATTDRAMMKRNYSRMTVGKLPDGRTGGCRCNTQQGTRLDVSFDFCMTVVNNGYFDHTLPDRVAGSYEKERLDVAGRDGAAGTYGSGNAVDPTSPGATYVQVKSGKPGLLW